MERNASSETLHAVLGGGRTAYRRTLKRLINDQTVPKDPVDLRIACGLVESKVVGSTELQLPIIDAALGAGDESEDGSSVNINAWAGSDVQKLRDILTSHGISVTVSEEQATVDALRVINLQADNPQTFAVCDASVDTHRHVYVQEPFTNDEHPDLFVGLYEAGIISTRTFELATEIGTSAVRTPWSVREAESRRPAL